MTVLAAILVCLFIFQHGNAKQNPVCTKSSCFCTAIAQGALTCRRELHGRYISESVWIQDYHFPSRNTTAGGAKSFSATLLPPGGLSTGATAWPCLLDFCSVPTHPSFKMSLRQAVLDYNYHTPPPLNILLVVTVTIDSTDSFAYTSLPFPYGPAASDTPFNCDDCPLQSSTVPAFQYFGAATQSLQFTANGDISPYSGFYTSSYPAPGGRQAPYISAFYYDLYPLGTISGVSYGNVSPFRHLSLSAEVTSSAWRVVVFKSTSP